MPSVATSISATIGGVAVSGSISRDGDTPLPLDVILPAAKTGSLTTRTDNDTGVATMTAGHGFATSDVLDVFWTGTDGLLKCRYGMTATVATNAVTIDGGAGDNLPTTTTALKVSKTVTADLDFTPEIATALLVGCQRDVSVRFMVSSVVALAVLLPAAEVYSWFSALGVTNPLGSDDITHLLLSNGDSAGTNRVRLGVLLDTVANL